MAKAKKLPKAKLDKFKKILQHQKQQITSEIDNIGNNTLNKTIRESSGDLSSHALHMADMATDSYDRDFSLNLVSNEQEALYRIEQALRRISNGTYGFCVECGKKISEKRLKAVPFAELCIEHQEEKEQKES